MTVVVLVGQVREPPAGLVPSASVTVVELSLVTTLPYASSTVTSGCVANGAPPVAEEGDAVKTSFAYLEKMNY